jgi:hypothetical protein
MRQVTVHFRRANLHGKQQQNRGPGGRTAQMADDECCINLLLLEEIYSDAAVHCYSLYLRIKSQYLKFVS